MAVKAFEKFTGGLTTDNARDVEDDQFVVLKNMFYNENRRLQSRRGVKNLRYKYRYRSRYLVFSLLLEMIPMKILC